MSRVPKAKRILVLALDGLDPGLFARFREKGLIPQLAKLQQEGTTGQLLPVYPTVSPVVWTSFLTGRLPPAHGILDFVTKAPGEYRATIGLYRVEGGGDGLFRYQLLRTAPTVFSLMPPGDDYCLWLPATFPAESPPARMLSGLGTPDLLATLGTSALYTSHPDRYASVETGYVHALQPRPAGWGGEVRGPAHTRLAFSVHLTGEGVQFRLDEGTSYAIPIGGWSPWLEPRFRLSGQSIDGLFRCKLIKAGEELALYRTPLWCHPRDPLYPLAQPPELMSALPAEFAPFPTAGFAGDQMALRHGLIERDTYLQDAYALWDAQAAMAKYVVGERREWRFGIIHLAVADALQHLFWRDLDPRHPAHDPQQALRWRSEIGRGYGWLDHLVSELVSLAGRDTLLAIVSDHGVVPLNRRADVNGWLREQRYLTLRGGEVDWAASQAFAFGHGGIWLNLVGRERQGCVRPEDFEGLRMQLVRDLRSWRDTETGEPVVRAAWRWEKATLSREQDPRLPDIGFALTPGYGMIRRNLVGGIGADQRLVSPNRGVWSGGHEGPYRPADVPGMLILHGPGIPAETTYHGARIVDLLPTLMCYIGASPPFDLAGRSLLDNC
jgi:predicted AlkP superfamily phosphohydrolase/phosphomutase